MTARQVILDGGSPWGFRMHGGNDVGSPLRISRVSIPLIFFKKIIIILKRMDVVLFFLIVKM